jgi:hypothetical protein
MPEVIHLPQSLQSDKKKYKICDKQKLIQFLLRQDTATEEVWAAICTPFSSLSSACLFSTCSKKLELPVKQ